MGTLLLPSERFTRFGNPAWPGGRTANFAAFGAWSETLLKNAESLQSSDALMRVAVPRRRGPAGLRDLFRFCLIRICTSCAQGFPRVRGKGWYHYPRRALRAAETLDARLSKRLICRFSCVPYLHLRKTLQDTANIRIYADIPPPTAMIEPFRPTNRQIRVHAEILVHDGILVYDIF